MPWLGVVPPDTRQFTSSHLYTIVPWPRSTAAAASSSICVTRLYTTHTYYTAANSNGPQLGWHRLPVPDQPWVRLAACRCKAWIEVFKNFIFSPTMTPYRHKTQPASPSVNTDGTPLHAKFRRRTSQCFRGDSKTLRRLSLIY